MSDLTFIVSGLTLSTIGILCLFAPELYERWTKRQRAKVLVAGLVQEFRKENKPCPSCVGGKHICVTSYGHVEASDCYLCLGSGFLKR